VELAIFEQTDRPSSGYGKRDNLSKNIPTTSKHVVEREEKKKTRNTKLTTQAMTSHPVPN
jgi:hypothetical protein